MRLRGDTVLRVLGLTLGLVAATTLVAASRIPAGTGALGADVIFASAPTGELAVSPTGPFLSATNLTPAVTDDPSGSLRITNQTGVNLLVQVHGVPSSDDLDQALQVRVAVADMTLFDGTLGRFRSWSRASLALVPGESADLEVTVRLNPSAQGWSGRIATVAVEFRSTPQKDAS
ncbi:MAG: hypothetical protein ABI635_07390 [Actinomycetota bacterium]